MPDNPVSNSGVTPTPPTPEYGRDKPRLGEGEEAAEPKPFSLPPEEGKGQAEKTVPSGKPSPMDVAREEAEKGAPQMTPEQLGEQINKLKNQLKTTQTELQNPTVTSRLTKDHMEALGKVVEKMNPEMRTIAKNSKGSFEPPQHQSGEPLAK